MTDSVAWSECAYVTITAQAAANVNLEFYSLTEDIDIPEGDRPLDTQAVLCGGKIPILRPQEDTTITLKMFPVHAWNPTASGTGQALDDLFYDTKTTTEADYQYTVTSAKGTRKKFRVAFLWTDEPNPTNAVGALDKDNLSYRKVFRNAYMTGKALNFNADGSLLSADAVFTLPAREKAGTANIMSQSNKAGAAADYVALTDYTSTTTGFFAAVDG